MAEQDWLTFHSSKTLSSRKKRLHEKIFFRMWHFRPLLVVIDEKGSKRWQYQGFFYQGASIWCSKNETIFRNRLPPFCFYACRLDAAAWQYQFSHNLFYLLPNVIFCKSSFLFCRRSDAATFPAIHSPVFALAPPAKQVQKLPNQKKQTHSERRMCLLFYFLEEDEEDSVESVLTSRMTNQKVEPSPSLLLTP